MAPAPEEFVAAGADKVIIQPKKGFWWDTISQFFFWFLLKRASALHAAGFAACEPEPFDDGGELFLDGADWWEK